MIVLGLDTATPDTAVGVLDSATGEADEAREEAHEGGRPRHTTAVLVLARELLERRGLGFADVDRVAVGTGPGTFTGLRVGVATARALVQAHGAELVAVGTLEVLARPALEDLGEEGRGGGVLAALDARRGEAYAALYAGEGAEREAPAAMSPDALEALARGHSPALAVGDGALRFAERLRAAGVTVAPERSALHRVSARALCELAVTRAPRTPAEVVPDYRRAPDAEREHR